jgi:MYXO-CTERM domain-containing protein
MTDQPSRATPTMAPLDALAVLLGLLVLVGGARRPQGGFRDTR